MTQVIPTSSGTGVGLLFQQVLAAPRHEVRHRWLDLDSAADDPAQASEDMARQLLSTDPREWLRVFGRAD